MSHSNFNPKLYASDDVQFKIVSRSSGNPKAATTMSASGSDYEPKGTHLPYAGHQKLSQVVMNDTMDIFNDGVEGGAVEPSINESIRQSIQCSFVSSECGESKQRYQESMKNDNQRNNFVMNRMNWITYLKVLFDQLEAYNQNKLKHVETSNFLKGLKKIKNLLPLLSRNDYYKNSSEVAFTYREVETGVTNMPQYITWDNVIDIFLTKSFATQQPQRVANQAVQQLASEDLYQQPQGIDDSRASDYYEEVNVDQSYQDRYSDNRGGKNRKQNQIINKNSLGGPIQSSTVEIQQNQPKRKRDEDFFLSFADSLINHGNVMHHEQVGHQLVAQAPLLGNPNLGLKNRDDDEACEIDSEYSDEESKNNSNSRRQRSKLEESIRSSRTATFKSVRRTSTHQTAAFQSSNQFNQHSQLTSALSQAVNVQDSYYQTIKNSAMPHNYQPQPINQQLIYYQQSIHSKNDSRTSGGHYQYLDNNEDGQVEVASNRSYGSQKQWKTQDNGLSSSMRGDMYKTEDNTGNQEKSTRISSMNSVTKNININQNNTILSQDSSQSSQNQLRSNSSKISNSAKNSTSMISQSNYVDLEISGKNLKNIDIDYKSSANDKRQLRSINFSCNHLVKLPMGLEKTLQFMNISFNKLKSLNGIEQCVNLKFLNVSGNQLTSANNLAHLQSMRELIFSHNQLSLLKEIGQLKNLQLLDVGFNKIIEFDKLDPLINLKKMTTLSLQGNLMSKIANYEAVVMRKLPQVKVLDPDCIKDYSQFNQYETICFTDPPENLEAQEFVIVEQISQNNLKLLNNQRDEERPRSRTPNRDRPRSNLGKQTLESKLKSTVISPQRNQIIDGQSTPKSSNRVSGIISSRPSTAAYNQNQFRLQNKLPTATSSNQAILPYKLGRPSGNISSRGSNLQPTSSATRDRSYTGEQPKSQNPIEENKSQTRDRSSSNISRNVQQKQFFTQGLNSGRSTAQQSMNGGNYPLQHQTTNQSAKDQQVKKISVQSNLVKTFSSQGKITPRRTNIQTPRQEKQTNYYKKSFCTEEESSFLQKSSEKDLHGTPSEKNTVRTAPTQDSSNKKHNIRNVIKKDEISIQNAQMGIMSPSGKVTKAPTLLAPKQGVGRPITTLKQRIVQGVGQIDQKDLQLNNTQNVGQAIIQNNSILQNKQAMPQSTKNNYAHSFVFDTAQSQGRNTPSTSQNPSNRPSSQLQQFITNSGRQTQQQNQQQPLISSRPSTQAPNSVMSQHAVPSQKLTNLPPRAYQSKQGNPGDKKSKADMSLSMISNSNSQAPHPQGPLNSSSHLNSSSNGSQIKHTSILQTGGNLGFDEDDSPIESPTSRSMSPVLEESSNMEKLKVGLTQFMNKQ